jgi:hypothetical protein
LIAKAERVAVLRLIRQPLHLCKSTTGKRRRFCQYYDADAPAPGRARCGATLLMLVIRFLAAGMPIKRCMTPQIFAELDITFHVGE